MRSVKNHYHEMWKEGIISTPLYEIIRLEIVLEKLEKKNGTYKTTKELAEECGMSETEFLDYDDSDLIDYKEIRKEDYKYYGKSL